MRRQRPEALIQEAGFCWISRVAPDCVAFAIPNGGSRNLLEAINLKKQGVLAGTADMGVLPPDGIILFLEFKAPDEKQKLNQKVFQQRVVGNGAGYEVVRSIDDIRIAFRKYGIRTREAT
jgi:hypothetical protein